MTKRRALLLSGGGSKIAWQVGVLKRLGLFDNPSDRWDIGGVSAGAILAALLGQETNLQHGLANAETWLQNLQGDRAIYAPHAWGIPPFTWILAWLRGGLFSTAPLAALLRQTIDDAKLQASPHLVFAGVVDLERGLYREEILRGERSWEWVLASASFPLAFPPVAKEGRAWGDGGVKNNIPSDLLGQLAPSDVTVIATSPLLQQAEERRVKTLADVAKSVALCLQDEISVSDVFPIQQWADAHPTIPVRFVFPREAIPLSVLSFDPPSLRAQMEDPTPWDVVEWRGKAGREKDKDLIR